jgi:glycosyltransferase involved in cell wall biosynthesis
VDSDYFKKNGIKNSFYSTNGVDSNYFSPQNEVENFSIIFTGVMDYPPNIDAAAYMASEVMPLLVIKYPSIKYFIVGRNPTAEIKELASDNVVVTGYVEDVRRYISRSSVYVSSLRYGTGIKNKILEAASMGKPIVATSISLEGLKHLKSLVLEANYPAEIVGQISKILDNKKLAYRLGIELREAVEKHYGWESTFDVIKSKINKLINNE